MSSTLHTDPDVAASAPMPDRRRMANAIRMLAVDALVRAEDGHPGTPLSAADIVTGLFLDHLRFDPAHPHWPDRDRFVQSNGHGSMLHYALSHLVGYQPMTMQEIMRFRELGSACPGHPEIDIACGIETTTGPLGQGIANAVGMAVAEEMLRARFGADLVDHYTYALTGEGCLMEGLASEVVALAGHLKLGRLIFLWDCNLMTDDGSVDQAMTEDHPAIFRANGWHVVQADGLDAHAVSDAITEAKADPRPSLVVCRSTIGFGVPRIQDQRAAHGGRLYPEDAAAARDRLGWAHPPFLVPDDVLAAWRAAGRRGAAAQAAWTRRRAEAAPDVRATFDRTLARSLPHAWPAALHDLKARFAETAPTQPGIASSGQIVDVLTDAIPELVGGAPDLEAATKHKNRLTPFTASDRAGRYVHYGVREHAMGAMMNGMAAHRGVVPYGVTFLVFSDYERPALRMAAMMGLPVLFVFSHDSIGIGKNGPTHQPVEYLASLRAIPNMMVYRPADAVEAAECWELALSRTDGPASLIFSRQPVPALRRDGGAENRCTRGAYVLAEATGGARRVTLLSTGSEVAIAMAARDRLQADGVPTAVVSMPCWERFEDQPAAYRASVIGDDTVRIGVEAAVRLGWDRYVGPQGGFVGMSTFGASGPSDAVFAHFGITPDAVVAAAMARLGS